MRKSSNKENGANKYRRDMKFVMLIMIAGLSLICYVCTIARDTVRIISASTLNDDETSLPQQLWMMTKQTMKNRIQLLSDEDYEALFSVVPYYYPRTKGYTDLTTGKPQQVRICIKKGMITNSPTVEHILHETNNEAISSSLQPSSLVSTIGNQNTDHDTQVMKTIDRIYYINMQQNQQRRLIMESWLSHQIIPYQRMPGLQGHNDTCIPQKIGSNRGQRCVGISGLVESNLDIIDNHNTTGMTLVLEDDFVIHDMHKLMSSISLVPKDWDVIRFDCFERPLQQFESYSKFSYQVPSSINQTLCTPKEKNVCYYCGGTHAVLWNGRKSSMGKLRQVWSQQPYDDIDCRLSNTTHDIKSYCINVGIGEFYHPFNENGSEASSIPKE